MFDPDKVNLNIAGLVFSGWVSCKAEPVTREQSTTTVSTEGKTGFVKNYDPRYTLTLVLVHNSPMIKDLDKLRQLDTLFPVMLDNKSDKAYIGGGVDCRFADRPDIDYQKEAVDVTFRIHINDYQGLYN